MNALDWLRIRVARDREKRVEAPRVTSAEVLAFEEGCRLIRDATPSVRDLEGFAERLQQAIGDGRLFAPPRVDPDECGCCFGRYSTCRNVKA